MEYEDLVLELVDFIKEMGVVSRFEDNILQIEYVSEGMKEQLEDVLKIARKDTLLRYGKSLRMKYPANFK